MSEGDLGKRRRLVSIDALRGLVMLIMLLDHVRETVYLHMQVGDPVDTATTSSTLFWMRFLSSFCAPAFVFLAGISVYLYQQKHSRSETSLFLLKRGVILILLELFIIGTAWTGVFPPQKFYLQIIWCIGICMIALAGILYLPRVAQVVVSILLIAGHNMLDHIILEKDHWFHVPWAILHQRDWITFLGVPARTSYPVLPWIGVITAGYLVGTWYTQTDMLRTKKLFRMALLLFGGFILLRTLNVYGDIPWKHYESVSQTVMGYFALTKYPASLLFLALTLAFTALGLIFFERMRSNKAVVKIADFGSVAMFFYIIHLYFLKVIYLTLEHFFGKNQGEYFGFNHPYQVCLATVIVAVPLWFLSLKYRDFKEKHREIKWLSYF